jgi:hypothetical protein
MTTITSSNADYTQLERFRQSLPRTCACTDELGVTLFRAKQIATRMRYIGPNHPNSIGYVPFDLDYNEAVVAWMDNNCPAPNFAQLNPDNGHAHFIYALESPVHFNPASSRRAQHYLGAVSVELGRKLRADPSYGGNLVKNPLHPHWPTVCFTDLAYELDTLAAHLDLEPKVLDLRRTLPAEGLGRNCTLFDRTRFYAYGERRSPQGWFGYEFFRDIVEAHAQKLNLSLFPQPLNSREVHHIAKSISKWTWANMSPEGFKLWGDNRRAKSIRVRGSRSDERAERIRELAREHPEATAQELANMVGLSRRTVFYALKAGTT